MEPKKIDIAAVTTAIRPTQKPPISTKVAGANFGLVPVGNETETEKEKLRNMILEARRFCSDFMNGTEPRWLVLTGGSGVGKTHVARRISDFMRENARTVYETKYRRNPDNPETAFTYRQAGGFFVKWEIITDLARDRDYGPIKRTSTDWAKVVDDIGAHGFEGQGGDIRPTTFVVNQLGKISDRRLGLWTVWTTNFSRSQIATLFDARIASRWMRGGNVIVDLEGVRDYGLRLEALKAERGDQ